MSCMRSAIESVFSSTLVLKTHVPNVVVLTLQESLESLKCNDLCCNIGRSPPVIHLQCALSLDSRQTPATMPRYYLCESTSFDGTVLEADLGSLVGFFRRFKNRWININIIESTSHQQLAIVRSSLLLLMLLLMAPLHCLQPRTSEKFSQNLSASSVLLWAAAWAPEDFCVEAMFGRCFNCGGLWRTSSCT